MTHEQALELCAHRSMFERSRWELLKETVENGLPPGHVMEFGVADGGVTGYLRLRLQNRFVSGYCRFDKGVTAPCEKDSTPDNPTHLVEGSCGTGSGQKGVQDWLNGIGAGNVSLIDGDIRETLIDAPLPIALAIVDLNVYEPTLFVLEWLKGKLADGGVVLVDDIYYPGVAVALHESGWPHEFNGHMAVIHG